MLSRLRVNVVVDNHGRQGAPVIVDDNPLFRSLFGSIEYESENDVLVTDFSRIRAGSLLKAHGGFLMLHLRDLMADEQVWEKLRRFLRSGRLQIEEPGMVYAPISAVSLQPEPVDVEVKIVLIASVEEYYVVQEGDPEFARRFRCKVDFAESFTATADTRRATAVFVAHTCRTDGPAALLGAGGGRADRGDAPRGRGPGAPERDLCALRGAGDGKRRRGARTRRGPGRQPATCRPPSRRASTGTTTPSSGCRSRSPTASACWR